MCIKEVSETIKFGQKSTRTIMNVHGRISIFRDENVGHFRWPHHRPKQVLVKGAKLQVENQGCWGFPRR